MLLWNTARWHAVSRSKLSGKWTTMYASLYFFLIFKFLIYITCLLLLQISKEGNLIEHFSTSYFFLLDTCEEKTFYNRSNVCIRTIYGYLNIWHEDLISSFYCWKNIFNKQEKIVSKKIPRNGMKLIVYLFLTP